jgi:hypothetical protein
VEKEAQNVGYIHTYSMYLCNKKTAHIKQSPYGRKFAQSGRPCPQRTVKIDKYVHTRYLAHLPTRAYQIIGKRNDYDMNSVS